MNLFQLLDTITNLKPIAHDRLTLLEPNYQAITHLPIGQIGTIVQIYPANDSSATIQPRYLVEFADSQGREYTTAILHGDEMLALHYELAVA